MAMNYEVRVDVSSLSAADPLLFKPPSDPEGLHVAQEGKHFIFYSRNQISCPPNHGQPLPIGGVLVHLTIQPIPEQWYALPYFVDEERSGHTEGTLNLFVKWQPPAGG